jgi:hypothetical protein
MSEEVTWKVYRLQLNNIIILPRPESRILPVNIRVFGFVRISQKALVADMVFGVVGRL